MRITIVEEHGDAEVWASLVDDDIPPHRQNESFIIGAGETRNAAIDGAIAELDAARRELEAARTLAARPNNRRQSQRRSEANTARAEGQPERRSFVDRRRELEAARTAQ